VTVPEQQPPGENSLMARVTLVSAVIAALAAIIAPITIHILDDRSQAANLRQSAYSSFISEATSSESLILNLSDVIAERYKPSQSRQALTYFAQAINPPIAQYRSAEDRLDLIAPVPVVRAAHSAGAALTGMEKDFIKTIMNPNRITENQIQQDGVKFGQAMRHFILAARGKATTT
jgi:hypothetical protein